MGSHTPTDIDPQELERARDTWRDFTKMSKWTIYAVVVLLVLLALLLL